MPIKTRTSGTSQVTHGSCKTVHTLANGSQTVQEYGPVLTSPDNQIFVNRRTGSTESIETQTGSDGVFRPCKHSKEVYITRDPSQVGISYSPSFETGSSPTRRLYSHGYGMGLRLWCKRYGNFTACVASNKPSLSGVAWDTLGTQAMQAMIPSFAKGDSLINFLLELKDFKRLAKTLNNRTVKSFEKLIAIVGTKGFKKKPFAALSNAYLQYEFGYKPFFNDLMSFARHLVNFDKRMDDFIKRAGKPQQSYYGTWISGTGVSESQYSYTKEANGGLSFFNTNSAHVFAHRVVREKQEGIRYHATMRYIYQLPADFASISGKLKAYLDILGVSGNPAVLWNAIPWSFVVDWFLNVNQFLDAIRVDNVKFKTEILDFCHSAKAKSTVRYDISSAGTCVTNVDVISNWNLGDYVTMDRCVMSVYERRVGIPNLLNVLTLTGLSPKQVLLSSALVGSRSRF